ncbi:hypothetical protein GCM10017673_46250 [Streptosporangium violaceochromogenes]|nr:hypothetical protein GCM10017673_46250 [Streptosporangium violaceochromogenes]
MAYRKSTVSKLIETAKDHDALIQRKGYKADRETDKAMDDYREARKNAAPEEIVLFERIYM